MNGHSITRLGLLVLFLVPILLLFSCGSPTTSTLAITHVTAIDPSTGTVHPDFTVVIKQFQISAAGPAKAITIPGDAKIIDATGKFLIPGLVDMHLHLTGAGEPTGSREFILPLLVANGITTVRDMGGEVNLMKKLREEIDARKRLGPQIFFTGPYLDGDPPAFQPAIAIHNDSEANDTIKKLKSDGVAFVKVQSRLRPEAYFAIARSARENGMLYVGHVPDSVSAGAASDAGQASIEHLTGILLACSTREEELRQRQFTLSPANRTDGQSLKRLREWQQDLLGSYSEEKAKALSAKFVKNHTAQVPTLPLLIHLAFLVPDTDLANDPRMKYVPGKVRRIWEEGREASLAGQTQVDIHLRKQFAAQSLALVKAMHGAGVSIMPGTDTTAPNVFPGFSLHEDLSDMVEAGLAPMEVLQAATSVPALFLMRGNRQGSIAPGQRADLLLLDANPLEDIRNTQKIRAVVLYGQLLERDALTGLLNSAERFAATH